MRESENINPTDDFFTGVNDEGEKSEADALEKASFESAWGRMQERMRDLGIVLKPDGTFSDTAHEGKRIQLLSTFLVELARQRERAGVAVPVEAAQSTEGLKQLLMSDVVSRMPSRFGLSIGAVNQAAEMAAEELSGSRSLLITAADALGKLRDRPARISTCVAGLDFALAGGVHPTALTLFQGPPGVGKTTLLAQIALGLADSGVAVCWIAIDESAADIALRFAQMSGFPATLIANSRSCGAPGVPEIGMFLAQSALLPRRILMVDGEQDGAFADKAIRRFALMEPERRRVVIIDSLQAASIEASRDQSDPRQRIEAVIAATKRLAAAPATQCAVLATVELARSAYRHRQQAHALDPLAAGKESGALEYRANALFDIRSVPGDAGLVNVTTLKARGYGTHRGHTFSLRLDREKAEFQSLTPAESEEGLQTAALRDGQAVLVQVNEHPGSGTRELRSQLRMSSNRLAEVLETLRGKGMVEYTVGSRGKHLWRITEQGTGCLPSKSPTAASRK